MVKTFASVKVQLDKMANDLEEIKSDQDAVVEGIVRVNSRQQAMLNDVGQVKGGHARAEVVRKAEVIALDMGFDYVCNVEVGQLARWAQEYSNSGIESSDLRSFRDADLVMKAHKGSETIYIAVEVSFTAHKSDVDRAVRNADYLRRFTGCEALPAIASMKNDNHVTEQVDNKLIHWHPISLRLLDPE
jgi:hypothetical protein